jgi:hypothetical protein
MNYECQQNTAIRQQGRDSLKERFASGFRNAIITLAISVILQNSKCPPENLQNDSNFLSTLGTF